MGESETEWKTESIAMCERLPHSVGKHRRRPSIDYYLVGFSVRIFYSESIYAEFFYGAAAMRHNLFAHNK